MRFVFFLLVICSLGAIEKVSIIVPCHSAHFPLLDELLVAYAKQTVLPTEIVISLSQVNSIQPELVTAFEKKVWPFTVIVLKHSQKYPAAINRKFAARASSGDLLMFQDADDLPHPQRVEIVKFIFENNRIDHLIHSCVPETREFVPYTIESIVLKKTYFEALLGGIHGGPEIIPLHHGHACMLRKVIMNADWQPTNEPGEDLHFNIGAFRRFPSSCYITPLRLVLFRSSLSYFSNTPKELR